MGLFDQLAEARIQDWIRRGQPSPEGVADHVKDGSIEAQLLGEIIALRQAAREEERPDAAEHLRKEANSRQLQLILLLERDGRNLAAQAIAVRLAAL